MGLSPIEYFATLRSGVLCCQNCERTALRRAAELYEDAHKRIADLEQELTLSSQSAKAYFENMKELEKHNAELEFELKLNNSNIRTLCKDQLVQIETLASKLKTVEDKLAAEKNKSESMQGILNRITSKKARP